MTNGEKNLVDELTDLIFHNGLKWVLNCLAEATENRAERFRKAQVERDCIDFSLPIKEHEEMAIVLKTIAKSLR